MEKKLLNPAPFSTFKKLVLLFFITLVTIGCQSNQETILKGSIDYLGESEFYIEREPLHYKYSKKEQTPIEVIDGSFKVSLPLSEAQIVWVVIQDIRYPVFLEPGKSIEMDIIRSDFPYDIEFSNYRNQLHDSYSSFLKETLRLDQVIKQEMDKFKVGEKNQALAYSTQKLKIAKKHFENTPFHNFYLKVIGEDLVLKLRATEYSNRFTKNYNADEARNKIFGEAKSLEFFSLESLKAQRAGIRDFTHYYSRTFGIYDSVITAYGEVLAEYDIKGVAYEELNAKRIEVLEYIDEPKAKAYAELFLVAERIGEQPFEISKPSYEKYISDYGDQYPEYISFLTAFYSDIKSVSPGEPAIPFSLSDKDGNTYTLEDFKGKFLLLDFWAGWCQPCLSEFGDMREIYANYSREDLEILAISTEVDRRVWLQDISKFKNPWIQVYGGNGMEQETFKAYKGGGIPFYILVGPDGKIARYNDIRPSFNFTEVLDNLLENYNPQN